MLLNQFELLCNTSLEGNTKRFLLMEHWNMKLTLKSKTVHKECMREWNSFAIKKNSSMPPMEHRREKCKSKKRPKRTTTSTTYCNTSISIKWCFKINVFVNYKGCCFTKNKHNKQLTRTHDSTIYAIF